MAGTLQVSNVITGTGDALKVNGFTAWTTGNDGAASGLDADLLNGYHGDRYNRSAVATFGSGDWDTLDAHGVYKINHSDFVSDTNAPPAVYPFGVLTVDVSEIGGEARIVQMYFPHNQDTDQYIYQRMRNAGSWTSWCKIWRGGTGPNSGLVSSQVSDTAPSGETRTLVYGRMGGDDFFRIAISSPGYDSGAVEIATADGGNEPIYVRQYTGGFGTAVRTLELLDGNGNTVLPGRLYAYNGVEVSGNSMGLFAGNADGASAWGNNLKLMSWFGIGFSPSISGQPVPYGEYSHWFNVRNGSAGMRGALSQNSDARLKENIAVIPDALAKVQTLRGITYDRKDGGGRLTGVIAQEVQAVLPEAVTVAEDEMKTLSVTYGNMVGLLIEAIKELKAEVDTLKAKVG